MFFFGKWETGISNFTFICWEPEIFPSVEGAEISIATQFFWWPGTLFFKF